MIPGRKNALFTEDGIRATIQGNLAAIEVGRRPAVLPRPQYRPYQKHPKYTGFLALYVHYLYLLGKTGKRQYGPWRNTSGQDSLILTALATMRKKTRLAAVP